MVNLKFSSLSLGPLLGPTKRSENPSSVGETKSKVFMHLFPLLDKWVVFLQSGNNLRFPDMKSLVAWRQIACTDAPLRECTFERTIHDSTCGFFHFRRPKMAKWLAAIFVAMVVGRRVGGEYRAFHDASTTTYQRQWGFFQAALQAATPR